MINFALNKSLKARPIFFIFFAAVILTCSCLLPPLHEVPPVAAFTADRTTIEENDQVSFTDQSINAPTSWNWDFGDGSTSSQQNPSHTYSTAGTYTVILIASNNFGSDTETKSKFIIVGSEPVAAFTADRTTIEENGQVSFTDQSINAPTSWNWDFGDDITSSQQNPSHTYSTAGKYTVILTASNDFGSDTVIKTNFITVGSEPVAAFKADRTTIEENGQVSFTDQSINAPTSWNWDFGDDITSSQQNPSHTYSTAGKFTVILTASNDFGSDTETKTNFITVGTEPVAAFTADRTTIEENDQVSFTDQSINAPTSWNWDFGDDITSSQQNPSHTYSTAGKYTVILTVVNGIGSDSEVKVDYITVKEVVVDIDGNIYEVVVIGNQTWMKENLKVTHYEDGTPIPLNEDWGALTHTDKAYCWYDNQSSNGDTYGALYTWSAAMNGDASTDANPSGVQGVCPDDWHLPSDSEWKELEMYLGMSQSEADGDHYFRGTDEGGKLKETGTSHWTSPNTGATNSSGFTALPGGERSYSGSFSLGTDANFWTATETSEYESWHRRLNYNNPQVEREHGRTYKGYGFSVRCVKN